MVDTLTNIESDAQHYANDSQLNASSGQGLRVSNRLYNGMTTPGYRAGFSGTLVSIGRRYPELLKTDSTLTTTSGTAKYTLPATPVFHMEELMVVYVDASSSSYEYVIDKSPSEREWAAHFSSNNAIPFVWKQYYDGSNNVIEFRPAPDTTSDTIKLWGYVQATPFATSASTTEFIHKNSDYALSLLIAGDWLAKRGKTRRSRELITEAVALLPPEDSGSRIRGTGMLTPWGLDVRPRSRSRRYAGF